MAEAVVEFDYDAVNGDELTLHKGAIIKNINMMEGGWWEGEVHGKRGMFPDNFVKVIEKPSSTQKPAVAASSSSSTSSSLSSSSSMKSHGPGPVANGDVSLGSQEMGDDAKVKKREGGNKKRKMRAKVTFSYSPQNEDELELVVNETVEVVDQPEEGWWEGVIKGKHGLFPSNFVTMVDEDDASEAKPEAVSSSGGSTPMEEENKPARKIKSSGIGHGNIFAQGIPQLRKTPTTDKEPRTQAKAESHPFALKRMSLRKKEHEEKKDEEKKEDKNASSAAEAKGIFKVKVIYDYEPKNGDELQLKKGEIVTVIDKDAGDSGWWKGELNGKTGVFPDNFTEEISEEKSKKKNMPAPVPARPVSGLFRASGDEHHALSAPPRPSRPGSMEVKGGSTQKPSITKQPSQDSIKTAPKENGSRHLPAGAKHVLPPPTAGRPHVFNKPTALTKPQAPASKPHDVKETPKDSTDSGKTDPKESTFDNIKINTEKLTHLNLSRPKATPNRRPPSTFGMPPPAASSSSNTPLSPLISPPPTSTSPPLIDSVDGPTSTPHPSSHTDDEPKQLPPWSRDIKKSLRRPPVARPTQDKKSSPSSTTSSSPPDNTPPHDTPPHNTPPHNAPSHNTPPLAPRSKHKKPPHPSSSPLAPIPDHAPTSTPSNTSSSASSSKPEEPPPSAPSKSSSQAHPPAAPPEKPRPPAHDNLPPRPPAPDHLPPRPSIDPVLAPKESHSSDPPWKTELKNRTNKSSGLSSASGAQSAENGSGPTGPPGRHKASSAQSSSTTTPTPTPATDTSSAAPPPRPAAGVTKTTPSINSSAPKDGASSAEVQELKKEVKALHETIASIKTDFKKEVKKLMTEVDEEKKHRMMMQVELERIKKLVMEGD